MRACLVIPGTLPGLNEYIDAERSSRYKAAVMKRRIQRDISVMIRSQLRGVRFKAPVVMHYAWYEPNRKRDKDNVVAARKFVQDALVKAGVLENDGWRHVEGFTDQVMLDVRNPRVEVVIEESVGGAGTIPAVCVGGTP